MTAIGDSHGIDTLWIDLLLRSEPFDDALTKTYIVYVELAGTERSHAAAIVEVTFISVWIDDNDVFPLRDAFKCAAHQATHVFAATQRGVKGKKNAGASLKTCGRNNEVMPLTAP